MFHLMSRMDRLVTAKITLGALGPRAIPGLTITTKFLAFKGLSASTLFLASHTRQQWQPKHRLAMTRVQWEHSRSNDLAVRPEDSF
jgi:hypothetical protein